MAEVARLAGVSSTTVSHVLNQTRRVSPETEELVLQAVARTGYRNNLAARALAIQSTDTVGVAMSVVTNPYFGELVRDIERVLRHAGYTMIVADTNDDPVVEVDVIDHLLARRVSGLIVSPLEGNAELTEGMSKLLDDGFPLLFLDRRSTLPGDQVYSECVDSIYHLTAHLAAQGHRRIGFINDIEPIPATLGRLRGYQEALAAHGIAFDPNLVAAGPSDSHGGYDTTLALFQQPDRPTALFCFNDRMAMGAYDALRKLKLSIPQAVAVIGFDNQEIIAAALHPGLSTMQLPHYQMGQWAINYLFAEALEGKPAVHAVLECPYIERESV